MQPSPVDPSDDDLDAEIEYLRALVNDEPGDAGALADLAAALLEGATRAHDAHDMAGLRHGTRRGPARDARSRA